jgi:hypothetical protein
LSSAPAEALKRSNVGGAAGSPHARAVDPQQEFPPPGFQRQLCYSVLPSEKTAETFTLVEVDLSAGRSLSVKKTLCRAIVESLSGTS